MVVQEKKRLDTLRSRKQQYPLFLHHGTVMWYQKQVYRTYRGRTHLGESRHEEERLCQLALRPVDSPAGAEVNQVEREYPEVDGEHHVGPRRLEAVVDAVLLGVGDAVKNQVHRHLGLCLIGGGRWGMLCVGR